ncbi:hypothetical protein N9L66_00485 [Porticoccaceae bacterium]|nr:hypothetical protein [Porticoccaceae bacterium]
MIFGSANKVIVRLFILLFVSAWLLAGSVAVAGEIPVKDRDTKDAVKDVKDAVRDNTDFLREATDALATTISGGLVAQSEGINASIGNMTSQIVAALNRQPRVNEKIKTARLYDPAIAKVSSVSCGRANVRETVLALVAAYKEKAKDLGKRSATHHSVTPDLVSEGDNFVANSSRIIALSDEETGLIELKGITRTASADASVAGDDISTLSRLDTLVNPFPAKSTNSAGKTALSQSVAAVYNSKKLIVSDTLSDIVSQRVSKVEVTDPYVLKWAEIAGATASDGALLMSPESYRVIKNTYRRQSEEWLREIEVSPDSIPIIRDVAMAMAQQLENQEEIIRLLTKSLSMQALSYSQLVDNQHPDAVGGPLNQ